MPAEPQKKPVGSQLGNLTLVIMGLELGYYQKRKYTLKKNSLLLPSVGWEKRLHLESIMSIKHLGIYSNLLYCQDSHSSFSFLIQR